MNRSASLLSYLSTDSPISLGVPLDSKLGPLEEIVELHMLRMLSDLRAWLREQAHMLEHNDERVLPCSDGFGRQVSKDSAATTASQRAALTQDAGFLRQRSGSDAFGRQISKESSTQAMASHVQEFQQPTLLTSLPRAETASPKWRVDCEVYGSPTLMPHLEELESGIYRSGQRESSLLSTMSLFTNYSKRSCGRAFLQRIVDSAKFEFLCGLLILANSVLLGATIHWQARHRTTGMPDVMHVVSFAFNAFFVLELCARLAAYGCRAFFCTSSSYKINWFDTVIVLAILPQLVADVLSMDATRFSHHGSNLRVLRALRLVRLLRLVRVLRIVRFSRSLQTLLHSIFVTLRDLFWAMLLLALLVYMFATAFTEAVNRALVTSPDAFLPEETAALARLFGDLQLSIHTLFMSIAGGLSWVEATNALQRISWCWVYLFCSYVAFSLFAVLNVMTGVFCNSAIKGAEKDQEMAVQALMVDKHELKNVLTKLFRDMDVNDDGSVCYTEFKQCMQDEKVKNLFEALDLGAGDAKQLFKILDVNKDNLLGVDEFLDGCTKIQGNAKAIDLFDLSMQTGKLRKQIHENSMVQRILMAKMDLIATKLKTRNPTHANSTHL